MRRSSSKNLDFFRAREPYARKILCPASTERCIVCTPLRKTDCTIWTTQHFIDINIILTVVLPKAHVAYLVDTTLLQRLVFAARTLQQQFIILIHFEYRTNLKAMIISHQSYASQPKKSLTQIIPAFLARFDLGLYT